jgi:fructuronate reductase
LVRLGGEGTGALPEAVSLVLKALDPELAGDEAVVAAVLAHARELGQA